MIKTRKKSVPSKQEATIPPEAPVAMRKMAPNRTGIIVIVLCLLLVVGVGYAVKAKFGQSDKNSQFVTATAPTQSLETLVERVRTLAKVSSKDMPTVATVKNAEQFRQQNPELYRDVQDDDRVLIWQDLMVIYSTKDDRVVLALPVNLPTPESGTSTPPVSE